MSDPLTAAGDICTGVEHFSRSRDWRVLVVGPGQRLLLETLGIELSIDALYELVF
jgi:hypothetical protein